MKHLICISLLICTLTLKAQEKEPKNSANFELGKGITFNLNDGDYQFFISGFIQPSVSYDKQEGSDADYRFNARRSFFMLGGTAVKEKVSFLVQTDFSNRDPLLDAWIAYHPFSWLTVTAGQKQNFVNNREMLYREDRLQFTDRSLSSRTFSRTGREFGLFVETNFEVGNGIIIAPKASLTSGDGRNSFGADSRDTDFGGMKIGGRLDVYPLGAFKDGNDLYTADLKREEQLKLLVGAAVSENKGASHPAGEGHGDFLLYDLNGNISLPDYSQFYTDLLLKYRGFSALFEYTNAAASGLDRLYTNTNATTILAPTQISEFLVLGDSFTAQAGYVTTGGLSFDFRFENSSPEFNNNAASVLSEFSNYTFGITKYFDGNNLKLQAAISTTDFAQGNNITTGELLFQIVF